LSWFVFIGGAEGIRTDGHRERRDPTKWGIFKRVSTPVWTREIPARKRRRVFFDYGDDLILDRVLPSGEPLHMRYA
jgi:hypothetical protein